MSIFENIQKVNDRMSKTDIKGSEYIQVNQRVQGFREVFPDGTIETEKIYHENGIVIFKATAKDGTGKILATGHAQEKESSSFINKQSYIENCETSAVGRALGFIGFGSVDSIASAEEVQNAIINQEKSRKAEPKKAENSKPVLSSRIIQILTTRKQDNSPALHYTEEQVATWTKTKTEEEIFNFLQKCLSEVL